MTNAIAKRQNGTPSVGFGNVFDNIFQTSLKRFFDDNFWEADLPLSSGQVPVNLRETEQHYEMDVIAPGCRKEDFSLSVQNKVLTVAFERKEQQQGQDAHAGWVRNEYQPKSFSRSFTLDDTVDIARIGATYTDGILRVTLPKNEKAKALSRTIEVK